MMLKVFGTLAICLIVAMGYLSFKHEQTSKESLNQLVEMMEEKSND